MNKKTGLQIEELFQEFLTVKKQLIEEYQNGYLGKKVYNVTLNNGENKRCEQITKKGNNGDAVVIIPITEEGNYVLVVESRPNTNESVEISFPAGMVDPGEDYLETAQRELLEETGYKSNKLYELEWHYQDAGCSNAIIKTYVALGCKKVCEAQLDSDEFLKAIELSLNDITELMDNNRITGANSKIAFMSYVMQRSRKK